MSEAYRLQDLTVLTQQADFTDPDAPERWYATHRYAPNDSFQTFASFQARPWQCPEESIEPRFSLPLELYPTPDPFDPRAD